MANKIKLERLDHRELLALQGQILVEMQRRMKELDDAIKKENQPVG